MTDEPDPAMWGGEEFDGIFYRWRDPAKADTVDGLHAAAFGEEAGRYQWDRCRAYSLGWVTATVGGDLVGFVNVAWDGGRHAFLLDIAVAPEYRRMGIGRRLVHSAVGEAVRVGCEFVHVDFEPHLTAFYRSAGFTETAAGLRHLG